MKQITKPFQNALGLGHCRPGAVQGDGPAVLPERERRPARVRSDPVQLVCGNQNLGPGAAAERTGTDGSVAGGKQARSGGETGGFAGRGRPLRHLNRGKLL